MTASMLPLMEPAYILGFAALGFFILPLLAERLKVPGLIGVLAAGALIGPNGLELIDRGDAIVVMGAGGLYYLMFMAGIELDLVGFVREKRQTMVFGALTFIIPQTLGTLLFLYLDFDFLAAALIASMFASHTLPAYPIASRLGLSKNRAVTMTVGGTLITDTVALILLAIIAAAHVGTLDTAFWVRLVLSLLALAIFVRYVLLPISRKYYKTFKSNDVNDYVFVLVALFVTVAVTHALSIEPILGAFFAGLVLNRLIPETSALNNRIHFFGNAFFIPFFLLSVGMLIDIDVLLAGADVWIIAGAMIAATLGAKALAAWIAGQLFGHTLNERMLTVGLSITQAAATLAATLVGYEIGLIGDDVLNAVILLILVTCVISPFIVEHFGRRSASTALAQLRPEVEQPRRILVPMAKPESVPRLIDLAMLIRGPATTEPIMPMMVVTEDRADAPAGVMRAERLLADATKQAGAAGIPVNSLTRVDLSPARGVVRAALERRSSVILMGWDASVPAGSHRLGRVLDEVVKRSTAEVCVANLNDDVRAFRRLLVVFPFKARLLQGFRATLDSIRNISDALHVPVLMIVTDCDDHEASAEFAELGLEEGVEILAAPEDAHLPLMLRGNAKHGDLAIFIGARRQTVAWERDLPDISPKLKEAGVTSFLVFYPKVDENGSAVRSVFRT